MEVNRVIGRATLAQAVVIALAFCSAAVAQPRPQATVHSIAHAQARVVSVDIPAQSLASALAAFAAQTGLQIAYASPKRLVGLTSPGFHGTGTVGNVLDELLRTSRLTYAFVNERTVTIRAPRAVPDASQTLKQPPSPSAPAAASSVVSLKAVTVTASRVIGTEFESPNPITTITAQELQLQAPSNIANYVNLLPAFAPTETLTSDNNSISAGVTGMQLLNLRNLGPNRTLVLVNGRRVVGSDLQGNVNIDTLPQGLINGFDVVTGGASAVYGSGAVAGVVNFKLDTDFTGIKGHIQQGVSSYGDDWKTNVGLTVGLPFAQNRGHFLLDTEHARNSGAGPLTDRPWWNGWHYIQNPAWTPTNGEPNNISVPAWQVTDESKTGVIVGGPLNLTTFSPDGSPRAEQTGLIARHGSRESGGEGPGHYAPLSLAGRNQRRYIYTRLSFDLSDSFTIFAHASYAKSVTTTDDSYNDTAGGGGNAFVINADNAYLNQQVKDVMLANGLTSFKYGLILGVASEQLRVDTRSLLLGFKGELGNYWRISGYLESGRNRVNTQVFNNADRFKTRLALDAVVDPTNGQVVCRSTLTNPDNGCVPINTFGGAHVSAPALAYVHGTSWSRRTFKQQMGLVSITGEPFVDWAGVVTTAFGVDYRKESVGNSATDTESQLQHWRFGNFLPTNGSRHVTEAFGEILLPLIGDDRLNFNGAARYADYSLSSGEVAWKAGLVWRPASSIMFRVLRSRDIRAPNLAELFQAGVGGTVNVPDPLKGGAPTDAFQLVTGNESLTPEIAKTGTIGIVLTPTWLPGFNASVDYYRIRISNAIVVISAEDTVDRCAAGDAVVCQNIVRDNDGNLRLVKRAPLNISEEATSGEDVKIAYRHALSGIAPDASLTVRALATRLNELRTTTLSTTHEFVGENSGSSPKWRGYMTATYQQGPAQFGFRARFISSGVNRNVWTSGVDIDDNSVPSVWYFGIYGSYSLFDDKLEAYFNVRNVFNKDPPVTVYNATGFNPTLYDPIGRYFSVGLRFKL